ncbi:MAG TPA: DUF4349 domain-containing protein [Gemmatimonadaceae bacterium]|nr:DUF4349 domain-containing protein [Gemmatimonadaceae bacterium]
MTRISAIAIATFALLACTSKSAQDESREADFSGKGITSTSASPRTADPPPMAVRDMALSKEEAANSTADAVAQGGTSPPSGTKAVTAATTQDVLPSMIIRTGQASLEVQGLDPAIIKLRQLSAQLGGYVANSSFSGGRDQVRTATIELKIPAAKYDQAVGGLNGIGKLEAINTSAEDVGEEYVDVAARVTNSHRLEERLISLLATRTGKLQDVLNVERELARVREEIERNEGRMRYLKTRAAVSTLSVTLHEPYPILGRNPGENPLVVAVRQAWRNFVALVAGLIASLGVLIPVSVLAAFAWRAYRRDVNKRKTTPVV